MSCYVPFWISFVFILLAIVIIILIILASIAIAQCCNNKYSRRTK